ncbi:hypothetical protein SLEP1_g47023 [Rubroshorea leprosula]|uniref:Reticulon-like protein n=1 Tax=Rubroshorea leprosula TaxID=152421 RepID=A0AAV5LRP5_9ROSI|nr:hypothetical protein SLEP1_g47023 [Rubroshorea leprosula]
MGSTTQIVWVRRTHALGSTNLARFEGTHRLGSMIPSSGFPQTRCWVRSNPGTGRKGRGRRKGTRKAQLGLKEPIAWVRRSQTLDRISNHISNFFSGNEWCKLPYLANFFKFACRSTLKDNYYIHVESFTHLAKDFERYSYYEGQSKAEKLLGGGKVSDILLWRDERKTFTCFLALALVFYWFSLCGRTFISSMASLLLWVAIVLCGYGIIPLEILDLIWRIRLPSVEISETVMRDSIRSIAYEWNRGARTIRSLAKGENWNTVFKVAGSLYALKFLLSYLVTVLAGMILVFAFTAFFIYEQYEFEIGGLAKFLFNSIMESKALLASNLPASVASYLHNFATPHQPKTLTVPMVKTQKEM